MNFDEALAYITALEKRGWRLGLDRMQEFVRRSDLDDAIGPTPQFIHIAGTNGKGSVTAYVQSILIEHGFCTGAFFSPYVYDVRERIQLNRELISKELFAVVATQLRPIADQMVNTPFEGPTEFEFKTAMGLLFWKQMQCEWVALEVGLGGRLDATNVVHPAACAIVSIGLDHTAILGDTVEQIAGEKAGIIKQGVPVVIGKMQPQATEVINAIAHEKSSDVFEVGKQILVQGNDEHFSIEFRDFKLDGLRCGIRGLWQPSNAAVATASLISAGIKLDNKATQTGIANAYAPGRMQRFSFKGRNFLLDGAHNKESAMALRSYLLSTNQKVIMIGGMLQGHNSRKFFESFSEVVQSVHLVPIENPRARNPVEILHEVRDLFTGVAVHPTVEQALQSAIAETGESDLIVVTGSFYLVGELGRLITS